MKKFVSFILGLLLIGPSCGKDGGDGNNGNGGTIAVTGVTLQSTLAIPVGATAKLTPVVLPADATNKAVTWSRLDGTGSVSVDTEGNVTGDSAGTATVTATTVDGKFKAICTVTVDGSLIAVKSVSLPETLTISPGESIKLTATVLPVEATNKTVIWDSVNGTGSITVDSEGNITGGSAGTATVTATTVEGNFTATCNVTVDASIVAVTGVTLPETLKVPFGASVKLTATVLPAEATNKAVIWSKVNGTGSVSVDAEGNVTGSGTGTATVSATTVEGNFTASCTVTVSVEPDAAGKYYFSFSTGLDTNSGKSPSNPWKNLSKINSTTFIPGDSIFLRAGDSWTRGFSFASRFTGIEGNPIVITSYGAGAKPNIRSTSGEAAMSITNANYLHIHNLDIGPTPNYGLLMKVSGATPCANILIKDVHVHDMPLTIPGIFFNASDQSNLLGNPLNRNIDIAGCTADNVGYLFAISSGRDISIRDCKAYRCGYGGFSIIGVTNGTIDNCLVTECGTASWPSGACGIFLGIVEDFVISDTEVSYQKRQSSDPDAEAIDFERDCHRVTVRDCYLHDNDGGAMMFFDSGKASQANSYCVIEDTVFENNGANAYNPRGFEIHFTATTNNNNGSIRNNTFKLRDGWGFLTTVDPSVNVTGNKDGSGNALELAAPLQSPPVFRNAGFEDFVIANGQYISWAPTRGAWTFRGNGGVATSGSGFNIPSSGLLGRQAAFLQGTGTNISQHINLAAGTYRISFLGALRSSSASLGVEVYVNGSKVGNTLTPSSAGSFNTLTTSAAFTVATGTHMVELRASGSSGDRTVFIDNVQIVQ